MTKLLPYDPVISFELESGMFPGTERIAVLPLFVATVHPGSILNAAWLDDALPVFR